MANIEGAGRGLVASRNIRARETILTEVAGVKGPGLVTSPVCPSCLAPVKPPLLPCSRCSLPCQQLARAVQQQLLMASCQRECGGQVAFVQTKNELIGNFRGSFMTLRLE